MLPIEVEVAGTVFDAGCCGPYVCVAGWHSQLAAWATDHQEGLWAELRGDNAAAGRRAEQRQAPLQRADGRLRRHGHDADPQEHGASLRQSQVVAGTARSDHNPNERVPTTRSSVRRSGIPPCLSERQRSLLLETEKTGMWANAQRDGRPAEHRWRPLLNAAKFGWRPLLDAVQ